MGWSDDEIVSIGKRFNSARLAEWASVIAARADKDIARLKEWGVGPQDVKKLSALRDEVLALQAEQDKTRAKGLGFGIAQERVVDAALEWWRCAKALATVAFDREQEKLAVFRTGVKVWRSVPAIIREMTMLVGLFEEHASELASCGGGPALVYGSCAPENWGPAPVYSHCDLGSPAHACVCSPRAGEFPRFSPYIASA